MHEKLPFCEDVYKVVEVIFAEGSLIITGNLSGHNTGIALSVAFRNRILKKLRKRKNNINILKG